MNAQVLGRKLLGEVEQTNLQELLISLHAHAANFTSTSTTASSTPHPYTNIAAIDRLIPPRATSVNNSTNLQPVHNKPQQHYPVIEITSTVPGAGKTQLLYYLTAVAILPTEHGGKGAAVVWMDTDGGFDVVRLSTVIKGFIITNRAQTTSDSAYITDAENTAMDEREMQTTIHHALEHVHVFRPTSLASLVATIQYLPTYLLDSTVHYSSARQVSLILLDSATAFFWQQRMAMESVRTNEDHSDNNHDDVASISNNEPSATYQTLTTTLRTAQTLLSATILTTTWGLLPSYTSTSIKTKTPPTFRPLLPHPWPGFATLRLIVAREGINRFPVGMAVEAALRDREARQGVVEEGRRGLWVWREGTDGVRRICGVRVGGEGVVVSD